MPGRQIPSPASVWAALLLALALPLTAAGELPDYMDTGQSRLQLCSDQAIRAIGIFNVGHSGLYLEDCQDAARILEPVPKQFTLKLARQFSGEDLRQSARELLVDNLDLDSESDLKGSLECLADAYVDGSDGDRFDVRYEPASGLSFHVNGEKIVHCGNDSNSEKYFAIWFGHRPFNERLKRRLLEGAQG